MSEGKIEEKPEAAPNENGDRTAEKRFAEFRNSVVVLSLLLAFVALLWGFYSHFNPKLEKELAFTYRHERVVNYDAVTVNDRH